MHVIDVPDLEQNVGAEKEGPDSLPERRREPWSSTSVLRDQIHVGGKTKLTIPIHVGSERHHPART